MAASLGALVRLSVVGIRSLAVHPATVRCVRFRLLPTDDRFFELFDEAAANVADCALRLREMLDGAAGGLEAVVACERRGDELIREILRRLNTSFVTPFDREDIHALAEVLDDVVDDVMEVGYRLQLGNRDVVAMPELKQQADLLVQMADETVALVGRLGSMKGTEPFLERDRSPGVGGRRGVPPGPRQAVLG